MRVHRSLPFSRRVLIVACASAAAALAGTTGPALAGLPAGATQVAVSAGSSAPGINASLLSAGSISGKVTSVAAGTGVFAGVQVFKNGTHVAGAYSNSSGDYMVGGLSTGSYVVCVSGASVISGGGSTTGYLGRCFMNAAWNGGSIPSGATPVQVTAGSDSFGVNIQLPSAAAIAGKVTSAGGAALQSVSVIAQNRSNGSSYFGFTSATGRYTLTGLTASSQGYAVCFDPSGLTQGTGFLPRCFKNVAWNGGTLPAGATAVSVSLGNTHTGIGAALPAGGAISGSVTDAKTGSGLAYAGVGVYSAGDKFLASVSTNSTGHYAVKGLTAATGDQVCVYPYTLNASTTYHAECWKNVSWNGGALPSATTPVSVKLKQTHTGINFGLSKNVVPTGSIAGTVREAGGNMPLQNAFVGVFTPGGVQIGSDTTNSSGGYKVPELQPSSNGYIVCVSAESASSATPTPTYGWAPRCYADAAWNTLRLPSGATKLTLTSGQDRTSIDITLPTAGGIAGTATDSVTVSPVANVTVELFTPGGGHITSTSTGTDGTYSFLNLSAGNYVVCFDGRNQVGQAGYLPQCFDQQPWTP
jgi:hypothetical protein